MKKGSAGVLLSSRLPMSVPKEVAGLAFRCPRRGTTLLQTPAEGVKYIPRCRGYRCHLLVEPVIAAGSLSSDPLEFLAAS